MIVLYVVILAVSLMAGVPAHAQQNSDVERLVDQSFSEMEGTLSVKYDPTFADGQIIVCSLVYSAIMRDHAYSQGRFIYLSGSFGFSSGGRNHVNGFLKIGVQDINPLTAKMTPSTPSSAYFVVGSKTTKSAVVASVESDTPGMIFVVMTLEGMTAALVESIKTDKINIAFARRPSGIDIKLPLDLNVAATDNRGKRTYKPDQNSEFHECVMDMMKRSLTPG